MAKPDLDGPEAIYDLPPAGNITWLYAGGHKPQLQ